MEKCCKNCKYADGVLRCTSLSGVICTSSKHEGFEPKQPAREPQCKTRPALFREFARVLEMCAGTGISDELCVKLGGEIYINGRHWDFTDDPKCYEFALAIVEGKPVWRGDMLYHAANNEAMQCIGARDSVTIDVLNIERNTQLWAHVENLTRNPPKPATISINGVEVKAPCEFSSNAYSRLLIDGDVQKIFYFPSKEDRNAAEALIISALEGRKP